MVAGQGSSSPPPPELAVSEGLFDGFCTEVYYNDQG